MAGANFVDMNWWSSHGASDYIATLYRKDQRRQFGLLERPILPSQKAVGTLDFKIFICGKSGVGKTSTITKLSGSGDNNTVFSETAGIQTTTVYWPVFVSANNKVLFFKLNFWDVGDNIIKKFDHILPACLENADCLIYTFGFTDRNSFEDIPNLITRHSHTGGDQIQPAKFIIGTKADQYIHSDITELEVENLCSRVQTPIARIKNLKKSNATSESELKHIAPVLNGICNTLWEHEQIKFNATRPRPATTLTNAISV